MTRTPFRALAAAAVLALMGIGAPAASAAPTLSTDTSDFSFDSFDAEYFLDIDADGRATTRVVETLVAVFPDFDQNRGIIRAIPLSYGDVPLHLTMVSVTDESGTPVYYERDDYDGFAEFALGTDEFVHGRTTYVLEYTLTDTIRHFADSGGDEFYWDINGDGWAQSFGEVSATVHVSPALAASLTGDSACYLRYASECEITRDGDVFTSTVTDVGPYNTLTVAIGFEGGTIVQPALPRDSWIVQVAPKILLGLGGLFVLLAILVRTLLWRDARGRGTIIAQFEPPRDSDLLLDANIIGRASSGLSAEFVDFAVRGMIDVIDNGPDTPESKRYSMRLRDAADASPRELKVLVLVFGASLTPGKTVNPGSIGVSSGAALYALTAETQVTAIGEGLRAQPSDRLRRILLRATLLLLPLMAAIWVWAVVNNVLDENVVWPAFGVLGCLIVMPFILSRPHLLTEPGAALRDHLLGMREYLTVAEEDRLRMLQSPGGALRDSAAIVKLNERLLGYAVLWGVEDQWVEKLRAEYQGATPEWFTGDAFDTSALRGFANASTSAVRPIVTSSSSGGSSWSSSGGSSFSSGSSGGGFSGGGGGGGGGGGR